MQLHGDCFEAAANGWEGATEEESGENGDAAVMSLMYEFMLLW